MNAREVLEGMIRTDRGDMTVHSPAEVQSRLDAYRAEVLAEHDGHVRTATLTEVTTWLVKKAREFHASSRKREREQGDTCAVLASKIARGAVRPDNLRMLPDPGFFEVDRTYEREHHGDTIRFLVEYVSTSPDGRHRVAHGWRTRSWDPGWEPSDSDDLTGWTDITDTTTGGSL